jgi:chromosome segregation ATPase
MLKNLDNKSYIILILTTLLILLVVSRPGKKIDYYKDEIKDLKNKNKELMKSYDSLEFENRKLDIKLESLYSIIQENEKIIMNYDKQIISLKQNKNETRNKINVLTADGVASEFTNYLKTKSGKSLH